MWEKGKQVPLSEKFNYKSFPRDMYYWRTVSRVRKFHMPAVMRGGTLKAERFDVIPTEETVAEFAHPPQPEVDTRKKWRDDLVAEEPQESGRREEPEATE